MCVECVDYKCTVCYKASVQFANHKLLHNVFVTSGNQFQANLAFDYTYNIVFGTFPRSRFEYDGCSSFLVVLFPDRGHFKLYSLSSMLVYSLKNASKSQLKKNGKYLLLLDIRD